MFGLKRGDAVENPSPGRLRIQGPSVGFEQSCHGTELRTGIFHLVSQSALTPSWCGMRRSNAILPMIQCFGVLPSGAVSAEPSAAWKDMVRE